VTLESKPKFTEKDLDNSALTTNLSFLFNLSFLCNSNPKPTSLVSLLLSLKEHEHDDNIPVTGDNLFMMTGTWKRHSTMCVNLWLFLFFLWVRHLRIKCDIWLLNIISLRIIIIENWENDGVGVVDIKWPLRILTIIKILEWYYWLGFGVCGDGIFAFFIFSFRVLVSLRTDASFCF
jgi:hypothetical protein